VSGIGVLTVVFDLGGCRSLKEKRGRLRGLRDRFGRLTHLAVCETDYADDPNRAQWTFVTCSREPSRVHDLLAAVERELETGVDAQVVDLRRELV